VKQLQGFCQLVGAVTPRTWCVGLKHVYAELFEVNVAKIIYVKYRLRGHYHQAVGAFYVEVEKLSIPELLCNEQLMEAFLFRSGSTVDKGSFQNIVGIFRRWRNQNIPNLLGRFWW